MGWVGEPGTKLILFTIFLINLSRYAMLHQVLIPLGTSHLLSAGGGEGRLYSGGSEIFLMMNWGGGGENKMTYGQGGHVFRQVLRGGGGQICSIGLSFH